jgi:hypothetical protein
VESSQEANSHAVQEVTARLQRQYEERLQEEQSKHREELEKLQVLLSLLLISLHPSPCLKRKGGD